MQLIIMVYYYYAVIKRFLAFIHTLVYLVWEYLASFFAKYS